MLTFLIVLIGLSLLILGHEAGHFVTAKMFGLKVDEFGIGFPPRLKGWKRGETTYSLNWLPFGGFVKIAGEDRIEDGQVAPAADERRYFFAQPAWRRLIVIGAGVAINFLLGWFLLTGIFMIGTPSILAVGKVDPGSPAEAAELKAGDILRDFQTADQFIAFIQGHPDSAQFTVLRDGKEVAIAAAPEAENGTPRIGVSLAEGGAARTSFFAAIRDAFLASLKICWFTLQAFYALVKNLFLHASLLEGVVGPVGIFSVASETSRFGLIYLFNLLAVISLNLAVMNLIPFPALDGGRLFLILVEKIKGSPVPKRVEALVNGIGFAFLILLMVLVTVRDVAHW